MSLISRWLFKHKSELLLSLASIPVIYYAYKKKKRMSSNKMKSNAKLPFLSFQSIPNNHKDDKSLSAFFRGIITNREVMNNIEQCLYQAITSAAMCDKLKSIGYKIIEHISTANPKFRQDLKEKLIEIANSKEISRETNKFLQFIHQDISIENELTALIDKVLNDASVIECVNKMAKNSCYKVMESQKVLDDFDSFVKEIFSNEELIKFIYNKAIDIFSSANGSGDNNNSPLKNGSYKF